MLDMSGDSVSGDTGIVILDALTANNTLKTLVLRDNPLGVAAGRKLLKAVDQGVLDKVRV